MDEVPRRSSKILLIITLESTELSRKYTFQNKDEKFYLILHAYTKTDLSCPKKQ